MAASYADHGPLSGAVTKSGGLSSWEVVQEETLILVEGGSAASGGMQRLVVDRTYCDLL